MGEMETIYLELIELSKNYEELGTTPQKEDAIRLVQKSLFELIDFTKLIETKDFSLSEALAITEGKLANAHRQTTEANTKLVKEHLQEAIDNLPPLIFERALRKTRRDRNTHRTY